MENKVKFNRMQTEKQSEVRFLLGYRRKTKDNFY